MFVGKGSDHLQLIKFRPSRATGKGVCGGANFFGSALLYDPYLSASEVVFHEEALYQVYLPLPLRFTFTIASAQCLRLLFFILVFESCGRLSYRQLSSAHVNLA